MDQLELILANYDKKDSNRNVTPKISDEGDDQINKQIKASVLEATKSF